VPDTTPGALRQSSEVLSGFSTDDKIHMIHYLDKMLQHFKAIDTDADAGRPSAAAEQGQGRQ
jgi:hypothetical protein